MPLAGGPPAALRMSAAATPGKPYCGEHAAMAYVRVRDKREDAAA